MENQSLEEALEAFQMAVEMDPEMAQGYGGLGCAYYFLDRLGEAEAAFETALDLDPTLSDPHLGLNRVRIAPPNE